MVSVNDHVGELQSCHIIKRNFKYLTVPISLTSMLVNQRDLGGDDHPDILDLVITNLAFIENIGMLACLGKSDHSV